jgi:hypothetical protein
MFHSAESFNQDLSHWNVSKASSFRLMFANSPFNQDISQWNVSNANTFTYMFNAADQFNQDLSSWNIGKACDLSGMFTTDSFNQDMNAWADKMGQSGCNVTTTSMFASSGCPIDQDPVPGLYFCQCSADVRRRDCPRSFPRAKSLIGFYLLTLAALFGLPITYV